MIKAEVTSSAAAKLKAASERLKRTDELMGKLGEFLTLSMKGNIEESRSPDGQPFADLAAATIKDKQGGGYDPRALIRTRALLDNIVWRAQDTGANGRATIAVGHAQFYGVYQHGGTRTIPARPFVGIREEHLTDEFRIVEEFVIDALVSGRATATL